MTTRSQRIIIFIGLLALVGLYGLDRYCRYQVSQATGIPDASWIYLGNGLEIATSNEKVLLREDAIPYKLVLQSTETELEHGAPVPVGDKTVWVFRCHENGVIATFFVEVGNGTVLSTDLKSICTGGTPTSPAI